MHKAADLARNVDKMAALVRQEFWATLIAHYIKNTQAHA